MNDLLPSAPLLGDQQGSFQDRDMFLYRGETH